MQKPTRFDAFVQRCKNNKWIVPVLIMVMILVGIAQSTDSIDKIRKFFKPSLGRIPATAIGNVANSNTVNIGGNNSGQVAGGNLTFETTIAQPTIYINGNPQAATKEDIYKLQQELRNLRELISAGSFTNAPEPQIEGRSFVILASFRKVNEQRRKYIFEWGAYSLFLDASNGLRFAAKDTAGEEHSVRLEAGPDTFQYDQLAILTCDAASSETKSFLRIRVNGKPLAKVEVDYDLKFTPFPEKTGPNFGARADGTSPSSFTMQFFAAYHGVLADKTNQDLMGIILEFQKMLGR